MTAPRFGASHSIEPRTSTPQLFNALRISRPCSSMPKAPRYPLPRPSAAHAAITVAVCPPHRNCRSLTRTFPLARTAVASPGSCSTSSTEFVPTPTTSSIGNRNLPIYKSANLPMPAQISRTRAAEACHLLLQICVRQPKLARGARPCAETRRRDRARGRPARESSPAFAIASSVPSVPVCLSAGGARRARAETPASA